MPISRTSDTQPPRTVSRQFQRGYEVWGSDSRCFRLCSFAWQLLVRSNYRFRELGTYEWVSAVAADGDLWLVGVDEDLGVASKTAAAVANHHPVVCPLDWYFVDKLNGCVWLWLENTVSILPHSCFNASRVHAHLKVEVLLLESRSSHGL